jgi:hypothetical protein
VLQKIRRRNWPDFLHILQIFQGLHLFYFDVNNMYTNLRLNNIETALYQFLHLVRARLKTLRFHIHKTRQKQAAMTGKNPGSRKFYSMQLHILPKFVMWELQNMVFWAGTTILRQQIGIAMDGCCSPTTTQILCIYCEFQ